MKRLAWLGGVYARIAAVVCFIIMVTTVVPYLVFSHTSRSEINNTVARQISTSMLGAVDYLRAHELPLSDADAFYAGGVGTMGTTDRLDPFALTDAQRVQLQAERTVVFTHLRDRPGDVVAITRSGGEYLVCRLELTPLFGQLRLTGLLSLLVSVLLGMAAMLFASHRMTRSLRALDAATRKVAAGDFTQRITERCAGQEFGSLVHSFNTMTAELSSVEMLRSNFISDISHEFKTPLTAIEGYAKLLESTDGEEERREYVSIITEETGRLCTLADNILMLNKMDKGNIAAQKSPVRIDEQIRRALAVCARKWEEKGLELELELDEVTIEAYDTLLMQLWTNLIDNAVKFSPRGGVIEISLHRPAGVMVFTIADQGAGVLPVQQERIFEKFYKADQSRGADGNGLGLSIVRRVAQLHGGDVRVESTPGEGATFVVTI